MKYNVIFIVNIVLIFCGLKILYYHFLIEVIFIISTNNVHVKKLHTVIEEIDWDNLFITYN
jgi:hypothetical protein